jgi:hypothetical protein
MVLKKKKTLKNKAVKKKTAKKVLSRKAPLGKKIKPAPKKKLVKKSKDKSIGEITHYFPQVRAAVLKLRVPLEVGEEIKIKGHTTDFIQPVASMQIDRVTVLKAKKGDEIGLLVDSRVRRKDVVYKVAAK